MKRGSCCEPLCQRLTATTSCGSDSCERLGFFFHQVMMLNQDEEGFFVLFFKQQQQQEVVFRHNKYVHIVENCGVSHETGSTFF